MQIGLNDVACLAADARAARRNLTALMGLLRDTLAELEREAIGLERLLLRQDDLLGPSGPHGSAARATPSCGVKPP